MTDTVARAGSVADFCIGMVVAKLSVRNLPRSRMIPEIITVTQLEAAS